jgi:hypothetical protein
MVVGVFIAVHVNFFFFLSFVGWGETEPTWYLGH